MSNFVKIFALRPIVKYTFLGLCLLTLLMGISWVIYPEKAHAIYARLVIKIGIKQEKRQNQVCYEEPDYVASMTDNVSHYLEESYLNGTHQKMRGLSDIRSCVLNGLLVKIENNEYFLLDTMYYSYPFLTPNAKSLLDTIGERFHRKLENTPLACTQFSVTSILRTTSSIERLRKRNRNSVRYSSHLHGTTFDISYRTFYSERPLTAAEIHFLGRALIQTVWELRQEKKCWTTYEMWQTCLHIVSR